MADDAFKSAVLQLLDGALRQPQAERVPWLREQAASDAMIAQVEEMLAREETIASFLESPFPTTVAIESAFASDLAAGTRIGAWELLRPLGSGGMGVVHLAQRADGSYEQSAALKFVRIDPLLPTALRDTLIARFDTERRLLARLEHPNIARIIDGGNTPAGVPWLAMEYVDGVPLTTWCNQRALGIRERTALLRRVCDGVQAAHRHLIVHGDLKPPNILVGADGVPRLLDFGIARALDPEQGTSLETAMSAMTPAYASPEQMRLEPLTTASDVYSLGVVLYELVVGFRPYSLDGLSPAQCERIVCETQPPTLRSAIGQLPDAERRKRAPEIEPDLERIVAKALHKDPARRYGSAQALGDDLQRFVERRPVLAHPDSVGYRAARFVRRHRVGTAFATLAVAALLTAGGIALWQAGVARRAADDTEQVNAFLLDMLKVSNPYASGTEVTLGEALDAAGPMVDERFGQRPDLAVAIRTALGESQFARFRLDEAEAQLLRAIEEGERTLGSDDARTVQALATLGSVRKEQGRIDEARTHFQDAIERLQRSGRVMSPLYAAVLNDLGVMHLVDEEPARALPYLEKAAAIDAGQDRAAREERARTLGNLAQAARGTGDLERADRLYREAQPVLESLYPDGGPHLAVILNNRARLAWVRGLRDEAIVRQQEAVAMHRRSFKGDHAMVLVPMTNLARMALDHGDPELASTWAAQALGMADRLYTDTPHAYHVNALAAVVAVGLEQARVADILAPAVRMRDVLAALDDPPESTREFATELLARLCALPEGKPVVCGAAPVPELPPPKGPT